MLDLTLNYRMVGGFLGTGSTFLARMRFCSIMAGYMALACLVHHQGWAQTGIVLPLCFFGAYLGRLIPQTPWMGEASLRNAALFAVIGLARWALIVAPYSVMNWVDVFQNPELIDVNMTRLAVSLFGLMTGLCYFIGNKWLENVDSGIYFRNKHSQWRIGMPVEGQPPCISPDWALDQAAGGGTEWGELLTGFMSYEVPYFLLLVLP